MSDNNVTREEFNQLKEQVNNLKMGKNITKKKNTRPPSAYNIFIREEIAKLKTKFGKTKDHKEIFSLAVKNWNNKDA